MTETTLAVNAQTSTADKIARLNARVEMVLDEAAKAGASACEVIASDDVGLGVRVRDEDLESVEFSQDLGFGITVFVDASGGPRRGSASTSDLGDGAIRETVAAACNIARHTESDPCNGLAEAALMAWDERDIDLDLDFPWDVDVEAARELCLTAETAALAADSRIKQSEGASFNSHRGWRVYGNSHGFIGSQAGTRYSLSCVAIAQDDAGMQRDHWYTVARDREGLEEARAVGAQAAARTVARLGSRPIDTARVPVLFSAEMAKGLVGHAIGALSGGALYRKASFLTDSLGRQLFPDGVSLMERPRLKKALGSAAFDGDGVATREQAFIDDGRIASYVLGTYSARRLGLETTGNAGGVHNLTVVGDQEPVEVLLARMNSGLLVTELMGQGVNMVTGDYSRGMSGFWVDNGSIGHPVEGVTIAGNLNDLYASIVGLGDDIDRRGNVITGSVLVEAMTIAG
jgi:PmbA protein